MKNIILIGFMASGKTIIGKQLALKTGMNFIDTDELIENKENRTINEIFNCDGEEYFRQLEEKAAISLQSVENTVIATGGGFSVNQKNMEHLRKNGMIVYLEISKELLLKRYNMENKKRPLMMNESFCELFKRYEERKEFYKCCDLTIDVSQEHPTEYYVGQIIERGKFE